jgi:hypothetical protein
MRTLRQICAVVGLITFGTSCATRTVVLDSSADIVRIGPNVTGQVYVWQAGEWKLSGKTKLPEGWYAGPGPQR